MRTTTAQSLKLFGLSSIIVLGLSIAACSKVGFSSSDGGTGGGSTGPGPSGCTSNCNPNPPPPPPPPPSNTCAGSNTVNLTGTGGGISSGSLTVNLGNTGDGHYYGSVTVSYSAGGAYYSPTYTAANGNNVTIPSLYDNGSLIAAFNHFYNNNKNFSGFFQNSVGAIVLSVSNVDANGCASGNVYYKNFAMTGAIQSPYRSCWYIYEGPYNCQDLSIMWKTSLVPGSGYQPLGSFTGLPVSQAFR